MRHWNWLSYAVVCAGVVVSAGSLMAQQADEEKAKEEKVRKTVLTRFDENRNDKLDTGEAKQARARLRNLLEDKSSREINIMTWRDDIHDLLRHFDRDNDNHLTQEERDTGVRLLERIIPKVETEKSDNSWSDSSLSGKSKDKSGSLVSSDAQRNQRLRRGSNRGGIYKIGTNGGFGNGMGYTVGEYGMPFSGRGHMFAGVGSTGFVSNSSLTGGSFGASANSSVGSSSSSKTATDQLPGSANGAGLGSSSASSGTGVSLGTGPLTDATPRGGSPSAGPSSGVFSGSSSSSGLGAQRPSSTIPDGLAGPGAGLTPPKGQGSSGPALIPANPRPNF